MVGKTEENDKESDRRERNAGPAPAVADAAAAERQHKDLRLRDAPINMLGASASVPPGAAKGREKTEARERRDGAS